VPVTYEPGKQVPGHDHEHTEQVMATSTARGDRDGERQKTRDVKAGDVIVINAESATASSRRTA